MPQRRVLLLLAIMWLFSVNAFSSDNTVTLVAAERHPYVSKNLPNYGYAYEIASTVFARAGYQIDVVFLPLARANKMVTDGKVDGLLSAFPSLPVASSIALSEPFPGDDIGLLWMKNHQSGRFPPFSNNVEEILNALQNSQIGLVRGSSVSPFFDNAEAVSKSYVLDDLTNIDMVHKGRVDYAVIDKYTAEELIIGNRPQLAGMVEFQALPVLKRDFHIAFATSTDRQRALLQTFNQHLSELIAEGQIAEIQAKHGLTPIHNLQEEKTVLRIATVNNPDILNLRELSKAFEQANAGVALEWQVFDENTLRKRVLGDMAVSEGRFDVVTVGSFEAFTFAQNGWLQSFESDNILTDAKDILPSVLDSLKYDNTLHALPFYSESSVLYYRQDLFSALGLTMTSQPTYADITQFAKQLHDPEKGIYGICLRGKAGWGENIALISTIANTYGGRWFDAEWNPLINSAAWEKALKTYIALVTKYGPPQPFNNGYQENLAMFADGKCGLWIDSSAAIGVLFDSSQSAVYDRVGLSPAPIEISSEGSSWLWTWALAVPLASSNSEMAKQFVEWATSKEYVYRVAETYGWKSIPSSPRFSIFNHPDYVDALPSSKFVLAGIENATLEPNTYDGIQFVEIPEFPAIGQRAGLNFSKVLKGELSIKAALINSQSFAEEQMLRSGRIQTD